MGKNILNKCDFCGLKVNAGSETDYQDTEFVALASLYKDNLILGRFGRHITFDVGKGPSYVEICAAGSNKWNKNEESCPYWQLKLKEGNIFHYLSICNSRELAENTHKLTKKAGVISRWALGISLFIVTCAIINTYINVTEYWTGQDKKNEIKKVEEPQKRYPHKLYK